jgi:hypothetical protein
VWSSWWQQLPPSVSRSISWVVAVLADSVDGDSLRANGVGIRLSNGTTQMQFQVDTANLTGSDDRFDPGKRLKRRLTGE